MEVWVSVCEGVGVGVWMWMWVSFIILHSFQCSKEMLNTRTIENTLLLNLLRI